MGVAGCDTIDSSGLRISAAKGNHSQIHTLIKPLRRFLISNPCEPTRGQKRCRIATKAPCVEITRVTVTMIPIEKTLTSIVELTLWMNTMKTDNTIA